MICWGIWKNRNDVRHGGKDRKGTAIVRSSIMLLDEFQTANTKQVKPRPHMSEVIKWKPPQQGRYKVNTDGAVFAKRKCVGFGVVVHDSKGEVIAALCKRMAAGWLVGSIRNGGKSHGSGGAICRRYWDPRHNL